MAWKREQGGDIVGFWDRQGSLEGILNKKIDSKMGAFFLVTLLDETTVTTNDGPAKGKPFKAKKGDIVGVSASATIADPMTALLGQGSGKYAVKLVSNGKKPGKSGEMWDIEVYSQLASEASIPF